MDVVDDDAGGSTAGLGDHGEDAREGEGGGDVALLLNALEGTRGEERQHEREGGDEQLGQREDDGDLLEDDGRRAEGCQERHVLSPDVVRLVDEQVREAVIEAPAAHRHALEDSACLAERNLHLSQMMGARTGGRVAYLQLMD